MKLLILLMTVYSQLSLANYNWGHYEGEWLSRQGGRNQTCSRPFPVTQNVCDFYGCRTVVTGCAQNCQFMDWHSSYGCREGYMWIGGPYSGSWQWRRDCRTWWQYSWNTGTFPSQCY